MDLPILNNPAVRSPDDATESFHASASRPLPMSVEEVRERGWDEVDVVFVTGDAYIDHPSFAMAILGRVLDDAGYRVAIISQPDWQSCDAWRKFGKPRLFFAISAGNMDSMINHYTANRKVRNNDAYSPGGRIGLRPDHEHVSDEVRASRSRGGLSAAIVRASHNLQAAGDRSWPTDPVDERDAGDAGR